MARLRTGNNSADPHRIRGREGVASPDCRHSRARSICCSRTYGPEPFLRSHLLRGGIEAVRETIQYFAIDLRFGNHGVSTVAATPRARDARYGRYIGRVEKRTHPAPEIRRNPEHIGVDNRNERRLGAADRVIVRVVVVAPRRIASEDRGAGIEFRQERLTRGIMEDLDPRIRRKGSANTSMPKSRDVWKHSRGKNGQLGIHDTPHVAGIT